jgi:hypothetical protein
MASIQPESSFPRGREDAQELLLRRRSHESRHVAWRQEPEREAAIRAFFGALNIQPTVDYLAGNRGVPDATRMLAFPLTGNPSQVTDLAKRILQELCGVSSSEPLDIHYPER